jgi:hypothetical protein
VGFGACGFGVPRSLGVGGQSLAFLSRPNLHAPHTVCVFVGVGPLPHTLSWTRMYRDRLAHDPPCRSIAGAYGMNPTSCHHPHACLSKEASETPCWRGCMHQKSQSPGTCRPRRNGWHQHGDILAWRMVRVGTSWTVTGGLRPGGGMSRPNSDFGCIAVDVKRASMADGRGQGGRKQSIRTRNGSMWPAPLAGWRPDSLGQGDPCLGKFGRKVFQRIYRTRGSGRSRAQASRSIAVAGLDVTLARDTPGLVHP